jgi:predicted ester cyclase
MVTRPRPPITEPRRARRPHHWSIRLRLTCILTPFLILCLGGSTAAAPLMVPNADTGGPVGGSAAQFTVSRLFDEVFTGQHGEVCTELMTPTAQHYTPLGVFEGPDGFNAFAGVIWTAFPDAAFAIDAISENGSDVAVRWSMTGTNLGSLDAQDATGRTVVVQGLALFSIDQGRISSSWIQYDRLGLLEQLAAPGELPPTCTECKELPF